MGNCFLLKCSNDVIILNVLNDFFSNNFRIFLNNHFNSQSINMQKKGISFLQQQQKHLFPFILFLDHHPPTVPLWKDLIRNSILVLNELEYSWKRKCILDFHGMERRTQVQYINSQSMELMIELKLKKWELKYFKCSSSEEFRPWTSEEQSSSAIMNNYYIHS